MNLTFIIVLGLFVLALLAVGLLARSKVSNADDFILAGRGIGFWMNVLNTISIGFAGTAIAFNPGFTIMFGFRDSLVYGAVIALIGYGSYGLICGRFVRTSGAQTLPEWVEMRYSQRTRNLICVGSIVGLCGILANNIVSMVGVIESYTGWPGWLIMTVSYMVILTFAYFAGMWGLSTTGFFQMIIGIIVIPLACVLCLVRFGGLDFISANWQGSFWANGIGGAAMPRMSIKYPSYLTMLILYGFFLIWGSNYLWLRLASCRNEKTATTSFTFAGVLLMILFYFTLSFLGLYAGALQPETFVQGGGTTAATAAFGILAAMFPDIISSLLIISVITAAVSTASTSLMGATATAARDIYGRLMKPNATKEQTLKATRTIMLLVGLFTWSIGLYPGGPTYLFAFSAAWLGPPAILVAFGMFWPRYNTQGALAGTVAGMASMTLLTVLDLTKIVAVSQYTHVGVVGFVVTVVVSVIGSLVSTPHYYGKAGWTVKADGSNRETVALNETDKKVLTLIRTGHAYMSDLTDALESDSSVSNQSIERLDRGGYIEREGLRSYKFNCFHITQKGIEQLPALGELGAQLLPYRLTPEYVNLMTKIDEGREALVSYARAMRLSSLALSSIFSHLVREGYITDRGLISANYALTQKGKEMIRKVSVKS